MQAITNLITLVGSHAALEHPTKEHHEALCDATQDGELWKLWYANVPSPGGMRNEIDRRLGLWKTGSMLSWAVRDLASGKVVGMTTFTNIDAKNQRVEMGSTCAVTSVWPTEPYAIPAFIPSRRMSGLR